MPVRKYSTLEEAEEDTWFEPGDPRIWEGMLRRWAIHQFFAPFKPQRPGGVYKYRSIEEKQGADQLKSA